MRAYGVEKGNLPHHESRRAKAHRARQQAASDIDAQKSCESVADIQIEIDAMPEGCTRPCCGGRAVAT